MSPPPDDTAGVASDRLVAKRFAMPVPGEWTVLPLDPKTRDRRIAGLVAKELGKDDRLATLRRQKIVRLRKAAAEASANGAFFAALHGRILGEAALAASVVVSMMPPLRNTDGEPLVDPEMMAATLAQQTDDGAVLETSVVELVVGRAARLRRRGGSGFHGEDGREVEGEAVHFYVPLSEANRTLVLVFSTPLLRLADAYAELFDLMAAGARWVATTPDMPEVQAQVASPPPQPAAEPLAQ